MQCGCLDAHPCFSSVILAILVTSDGSRMELCKNILFSNKKYSNIKFIENGGWHFSNMKSPAEIEKKMRTYLHHREYDINPLVEEKIKEIIKSKKSIYNLRADMKNEKFDGTQNLKPTDGSELPNYIKINKKKYLNWIE